MKAYPNTQYKVNTQTLKHSNTKTQTHTTYNKSLNTHNTMARFQMDMCGTIDRFQKVNRVGAICSIKADGTDKYIQVPCAWCNEKCDASAANCLTDQRLTKIENQLANQIKSMNAFKRVSFDALGHVHKYIFNTDLSKQKYWRWAHPECISFSSTTKSGREVRQGNRFSDETFVKGSGVSGCDQYDRGYDHGTVWGDYERHGKNDYSKLSEFVVSDDVTEHDEEMKGEEEEEEFGSDYSDEEEESDVEYSDYDSEEEDDDEEEDPENKIVMKCTNNGCNFSESFNSIEEAQALEWDKDLTGDWVCAPCGCHLADSLISEDEDCTSEKFNDE